MNQKNCIVMKYKRIIMNNNAEKLYCIEIKMYYNAVKMCFNAVKMQFNAVKMYSNSEL